MEKLFRLSVFNDEYIDNLLRVYNENYGDEDFLIGIQDELEEFMQENLEEFNPYKPDLLSRGLLYLYENGFLYKHPLSRSFIYRMTQKGHDAIKAGGYIAYNEYNRKKVEKEEELREQEVKATVDAADSAKRSKRWAIAAVGISFLGLFISPENAKNLFIEICNFLKNLF